jgi:hypothetical protein
MSHAIARRPVAQRLREWLIARCLAPINLDGSQVSDVTIDGQSVSAVTMDGDQVFGDAIRDSVTNHWPHDEGSGSTLNDNEASLDFSIDGATWQTGAGNGGAYLEYDGGDDRSTESTYAWDDTTFSWLCWVNPDDLSNYQVIIQTGDDQSNDYAVAFELGLTSREINAFINNGDGGSNVVITTSGASTGTWIFLAMAGSNNDELVFYWGTASDSDLTTAGSQNWDNGLSSSGIAAFGAREENGSFSRHYDGSMDDVLYASGTKMTQSEIESYFDDTKGRY